MGVRGAIWDVVAAEESPNRGVGRHQTKLFNLTLAQDNPGHSITIRMAASYTDTLFMSSATHPNHLMSRLYLKSMK